MPLFLCDLFFKVLDDIDLNEEIDDDDETELEFSSDLLILKLRTLVKKIRKSVKLRQKLKKLCGMYQVKYLVPIIDVKIRWNSSFYMIQRAEHSVIPLKNLCLNDKSLKSLLMSDSEWNVLKNIQKLLAKFERATQLISMQRYCNIPSYLPTFNWLAESLEEYIENNSGSLAHAAEAGLTKLKKYEFNVRTSKLPFIATFLNPACKMNYFKEFYSTTATREIRQQIIEYFSRKYEGPTPSLKRSIDEVDEGDEDELYAHMFKRTKVEKLSSEMQKYISLPLSNKKVDPIQFWKSQADEFPNMSRMARDFLPLQGGSVSVERDFSGAVDLITPKRGSLSESTIRADMCLKSWLKPNK